MGTPTFEVVLFSYIRSATLRIATVKTGAAAVHHYRRFDRALLTHFGRSREATGFIYRLFVVSQILFFFHLDVFSCGVIRVLIGIPQHADADQVFFYYIANFCHQ